MTVLDIRKTLPSDFTERELNDLIQAGWERGDDYDTLKCTMGQIRYMSQWFARIPLKRTLLDRLLFRTRYSDGSLAWNGQLGVPVVRVYASDFGYLDVEVGRE